MPPPLHVPAHYSTPVPKLGQRGGRHLNKIEVIRATHEFNNRARQGRLGMEVDAVRGEANSLYG